MKEDVRYLEQVVVARFDSAAGKQLGSHGPEWGASCTDPRMQMVRRFNNNINEPRAAGPSYFVCAENELENKELTRLTCT